MSKEEILKEQIEGYQEEKKRLDMKIRKAKGGLRWLKLKRLTQKKGKMGNGYHRGKKLLRWE